MPSSNQNDFPWHNLNFMASQQSETPCGSIHFARSGNDPNKPTIVFFHGVLRNWRSYYPILSPLLKETNLISVDFRGHGNSCRAGNRYHVMDYVEDGCRILNQVDGPVTVYGHSLGAMVAFAVSCLSSKPVHCTILEDPPFRTMGSCLRGTPLMDYFASVEDCLHEYTNNFLAAQPGATHSQRVDYLHDAFSNIVVGRTSDGNPIRIRDTRDKLARQFAAEALVETDPNVLGPITEGNWLDGYDLEKMLAECPLRNIHLLQSDSRMGGMLTDEDCDLFQRHLKDRCTRTVFPGIGHSIHWSAPDRIIRLLQMNQLRKQ